jgi:tetratricopeptide (TPR) repeat protein
VRHFNKKTLIILGVVFLALCSALAAGFLYFRNTRHRQQILIESADAYMTQKDYSRAELQYRHATSLKNPTGEMFYKYGLCLEKLEKPMSAFHKFQEAVAADPGHWEALKRVAGVYYSQSRRALAQTDADLAKVEPLRQLEATARSLVRLRPGEREGYIWLARARALARKPDEALAAIEDGRAKAPGDDELTAEKVRILAGAQRLAEAEKTLQLALQQRPDSPELLLLSAEIAQRDGRFDEARQALARIIEMDKEKKNVEAHRQLALLQWRQEHLEEAEREFKAVCELAPEQAASWIELSQFRLEVGRTEASLKALEQGRGVNPRNVDIAIALCRAQVAAHKLDDAGKTIAELGGLGLAANGLAWLEGEVAFAAGKVSEAQRKFLEATRKGPAEFAEAHFDLGRCYSSEGNFGAAEEQFRIASHSPAVRPRASMALAEAYLFEGEPARALAQCAEIRRDRFGSKERPMASPADQDPALLTLEGRAQSRLMKFDDADRSFHAALEAARDPSRKAEALVWLARLSLSRRIEAMHDDKAPEAAACLAAAQQAMAEADKLAPENASVTLMDAQLAKLSGDKEKALELRKRATVSPAVAALLFREVLGPDEKDVATATGLLAAHPENAGVQGAAADYFAALALSATQKAMRDGGKPETLRTAGREYRDQAIACARSAFVMQKTDKSAAIRLFGLLRSHGRAGEAQHAEEAQQLASELANVPATKALGLALEGLVIQDQGVLKNDDGRKEEAIQKLKQSVVADDQDWRPHFWLAGVYASMSGHGAEAEVELGKTLALDPVAPGATDLLLQVLESEGKSDRVQEEIGKLAARSALGASVLARSAQLYERTGEWDKAADRWKQALEAAPRVAQWHIEYSQVLDRLGRKDEAVAEANRAAEIGPPSVQTARARIWAYLARGDRGKAELLLLDTVKALPDDPAAYFMASDLYQTLGAPSEAESWLKQLAERRKDDPEALRLLADFFTKRQRYDEAIREYRDALRIRPDFAPAEYGVIQAELLQAARTENAAEREALLKDAEQQAAALQKQDPKSLPARMVTADLLMARGELDRAEESLQAVAKDFDKRPAVRIALARLYLRGEKLEEGERELAAALAVDDHLVEAQTLLAEIHMGENRYKQALEECRVALRYEPMNAAALSLSARIKQRTGRGAEAVADLRKVVSLYPADPAALTRLVEALIAVKANGDALAAAREACAKNPTSAAFCQEYVFVLLSLKQFEEAAAECRAFLATNTDNETANLMLAGVLYNSGAASQAQQALQAAEQAAKEPRLFLMRAARVCSRGGDHERAIAYAARLAEQSPADLAAVSLRADVLLNVGRGQEAAQVAVDAQKGNPESIPFLREAAAVLVAAKQTDQAAALCADFLKRRPEEIAAGLVYIEMLMRSGRRAEALAETKRVESVAGAKPAPAVGARLVRFYGALGDAADAERLGLRLCEQTPNSAQAWLTCAAALEAQGPSGLQRAIPLYRKALSHSLSGHTAKAALINNLAYALAESSFPTAAEKDRALSEAELLADGILGDRETAPSPLLDTVGWVKFARNKFDEAQQLLALATSRPNDSGETWYHYAMACASIGRAEEALKAADKAMQLGPKGTQWLEAVKAEIARNQKKP